MSRSPDSGEGPAGSSDRSGPVQAGSKRRDSDLSPRARVHRSRSRSWALQVLYRWEAAGAEGSLVDVFHETARLRRVAPARVSRIMRHLERVEANLPQVDQVLRRALDNWRLERLAVVDRSVLRLAASEMLFDDEVPPLVALQEGIRLAGQYGGPQSPRFVNGVLDAVFREMGAPAQEQASATRPGSRKSPPAPRR